VDPFQLEGHLIGVLGFFVCTHSSYKGIDKCLGFRVYGLFNPYLITSWSFLQFVSFLGAYQILSLRKKEPPNTQIFIFVGLSYQGKKDIVFRFIIEYTLVAWPIRH
jgi:hypothetical protein